MYAICQLFWKIYYGNVCNLTFLIFFVWLSRNIVIKHGKFCLHCKLIYSCLVLGGENYFKKLSGFFNLIMEYFWIRHAFNIWFYSFFPYLLEQWCTPISKCISISSARPYKYLDRDSKNLFHIIFCSSK